MTIASPQPLTEVDFRRVADTLHAHCGIYLTPAKKHLVASRLAGGVRRAGVDSYANYLDRILADRAGDEFQSFVDALSTNLTDFFREPQHFAFLRDEYLPALRRRGNRLVRGWSAGCSTGEEAYSLVMTLLDTLPAAENWDVKVLATDLSTRALARAIDGVYDESRVASLPTGARAKYIDRQRGEATVSVSAAVRQCVAFRYLNLIEPWPFRGPMDFIFCRNVMIYFDKPTQERVVNRFYQMLRPGGLLMVGHSESLTGLRHRLRAVRPTIYQR